MLAASSRVIYTPNGCYGTMFSIQDTSSTFERERAKQLDIILKKQNPKYIISFRNRKGKTVVYILRKPPH
jgi:hypothetical protein